MIVFIAYIKLEAIRMRDTPRVIEPGCAVCPVAEFRTSAPRNRSHHPVGRDRLDVADFVIAAVSNHQASITGNCHPVWEIEVSQPVGTILVAAYPSQSSDGPDHPVRSLMHGVTDRMV